MPIVCYYDRDTDTYVKAHEAADVIVFEDAVTHALPAGNILCGLNVVGVVGNPADENNP